MNILFLEFSKINHIFSHEYFYNMRWHEISQLYIRMSYAIHTAWEPGGRSEQYFMHARVSHFVLLTWLDMTRTFAARVLLDRLGSWDDGDATSIHVSCSRVQIFPFYPTCSQASLVTKTWSNWSIGKDLKHGCQLLLTSSFPQAAYHSCRLFFILRSFWSQGLAPTTWSFILTSQDLSGHQNLIHPDPTKKPAEMTCHIGGLWGTRFAVWAPSAHSVSLVGDFNFWDSRAHPMFCREKFGVWEIFLPMWDLRGQLGHVISTRCSWYLMHFK